MELLFIVLWIAYLAIYIQRPYQSPWSEPSSLQATVVVPFQNEEANIRRLVQSLHLHSQKDLFFLFVNDGSIDRSEEFLQHELDTISGMRYRIIHAKGNGKLGAITLALDEVDTEWMIVLDADTQINIKTLEALSSPPAEHDVLFVPVRVGQTTTSFSDFQQLEYMAMNATSSIFSKNNVSLLNSSAAVGMRKATWESFAGEQEGQNGPFDAELSGFLMRHNADIYFWDDSETVAETEGKPNWEDFILQRSKWGIAAISNWRLILFFLFIYAVNLSVFIGLFYGRIGRFYLLAKIATDVLFFRRWQPIYGLSFATPQLVLNAILYTPYILLTPIYGFYKSISKRTTEK